MKAQTYAVLQVLETREATCEDLARELDIPEASARRAITELQKAGYRIVRPITGGPGSADYPYRLL